MLVSSSGISAKATGITNGLTIASSRAGGTKTSSMDSVFTLAPSPPQPSLESGKWVNESSGSQKQNVTVLETDLWTIQLS